MMFDFGDMTLDFGDQSTDEDRVREIEEETQALFVWANERNLKPVVAIFAGLKLIMRATELAKEAPEEHGVVITN